jgi:hypothetical protein
MREEDNEDSRRGGAEVTRRRRRRGRPPRRGVCCPESWGGNRSDILFYFIGQPTQHPPPVSLPSPTQLASSIVDVRCHRSSSSFSSSSHFVAASKSHVALLVESFVHMMQASKRFLASLRTRHPSQLIRRHRRVRPSLSSLAPTPLAMRMDLAANTMAESSLTSSSRIRRLTDLQILLRNLQRFHPPPLPVHELLCVPPDCRNHLL